MILHSRFIFLFLLSLYIQFFSPFFSHFQASFAQELQSLNIFCIGNSDGTANCTSREDAQNLHLKCIMISESIIQCSDSSVTNYECVAFGPYLSNQSEFSCSGSRVKFGATVHSSDFNPQKFRDPDFRSDSFD